MADLNNSGSLDEYEFKEVLKKVEDRYPQIVIYLRRKTFRELLKVRHGGELGTSMSLHITVSCNLWSGVLVGGERGMAKTCHENVKGFPSRVPGHSSIIPCIPTDGCTPSINGSLQALNFCVHHR